MSINEIRREIRVLEERSSNKRFLNILQPSRKHERKKIKTQNEEVEEV